MDKKNISIAFENFWKNFNPFDNNFVKILSEKYDVTVKTGDFDVSELDCVFYSCFGSTSEFLKKYVNVKKIYFSGENDFPDFGICDYSITSSDIKFDRHYRMPYWAFEYFGKDLEKEREEAVKIKRDKFCSFVVSNNNNAHPLRMKIFNALSQYKKVDSGGKIENNVGGPVEDKQKFISEYKFNIASENSIVEGYVTEKIADAFSAGCLPVYMGSNRVLDDFNPFAFINVMDYSNLGELLDAVKGVDSDDELFKRYQNSALFNESGYQQKLENGLRDFLFDIIEDGIVFNHTFGRIGLKNIYNKILC